MSIPQELPPIASPKQTNSNFIKKSIDAELNPPVQSNTDVIAYVIGVLRHQALKIRHYFMVYNVINFIINDRQ